MKHSLHPSTEASTTEDHFLAVATNNFGAGYSEVRSHEARRSLRTKRSINREGKGQALGELTSGVHNHSSEITNFRETQRPLFAEWLLSFGAGCTDQAGKVTKLPAGVGPK